MGGGGGFGQKRHGVVSWGEMTNNKGFLSGFFWVKFGGGRIGGGGGVFVAGSFAGFGQRVRIGVWPGR